MGEYFHINYLLLTGLLVVIGFYIGNIARRFRLPSLIGFMIMGVFLGPSVLHLFSEASLYNLTFVTQIALGFVALTIGAELSIASLRQLGSGIISIILVGSFMAFLIVALAVYALTRSLPAALLFGAVAPASAPAGTVAVIQEYRAKGPLTKALYAVVGFDDGLAILIFGFAAAFAKNWLFGTLNVLKPAGGFLAVIGGPALEIVGSIVLGIILGFIFTWLIQRLRATAQMLIITFGIVLIATGISLHFHLSLILTNMFIGFVLVNTRREAFVHRVMRPTREIMPLLFVLFFGLAGAHLQIGALPKLGLIGIVYVLARSLGKIGGARLGAEFGKVPEKVKKYIGFGILSQAGVAIGLALIIRHEFVELCKMPEVAEAVKNYAAAHITTSRFLFDPLFISAAVITTITATCIIFEIIGPILTKFALSKAGEIPQDAH